MSDLRDLGWNDALEQQRLAYGTAVEPARVVAEHRDLYRVRTAGAELGARVSGRLRHAASRRGDLPAVGDWVLVTPSEGDRFAVIRHILPRSSCFSRKVAGSRTSEQVVAANIDFVWIANALDQPLSVRRIERYLSIAWESGAMPVVLLTKSDLAVDVERAELEVARVAIGVPVHSVSGVTGAGTDTLDRYLRKGQTIALLGLSGAGKSTLINRLLGEERLRVEPVRAGDRKGRHTTTHRQLIQLPSGGLIVDTPGMRELQLWDAESGIQETFADIEELADRCRFRDCRHSSEPGCAVLEAVQAGLLEPERLDSYHKLEREQAYLARRTDARAQAEQAREVRIVMKSLKHHPKYRRD